MRELPTPRNPGDFDYGAYLLRKGILGQMNIKQKGPVPPRTTRVQGKRGVQGSVKILARDNINFIKRIAARGREYMEKIIDLGPYDGGREALLKAMLIGKREGIDKNLKQNFINTGTIHTLPTQCRENYNLHTACHFTLYKTIS